MTLTVGFDDNLGCPPSVVGSDDIQAIPYHDLDRLVADFATGAVVAAFVPAGSIPYLRGTDYSILAQAEVGESTLMQSDLSVRRGQPWSIAEVVAGSVRLGAINSSCTTSYWAPQIVLMGLMPAGSAISFVQVNGFQDLFEHLLSGGCEAAMVWDQVSSRQRDKAADLDVVLRLDNLPAPLVLGHPSLTDPERAVISTAFCSAPLQGPPAFFDRFTAPNVAAVSAFADLCAAAQGHFAAEPIAVAPG
ncbi:MAG: PhnD/SsuA/transferrin family substrate-binding protein [Actinomycetota bacterium]|nr:PhnD/SsuA/transferrin family substrate-binding protein [Actinomycetota bacterium]